jgi:exopolysaccharide production protein ExoQ
MRGALRMSGTSAIATDFARTASPARRPPAAICWGVFVLSVTALLLAGFVGSVGAMLFVLLWSVLAVLYARSSLAAMRNGPMLAWLMAAFVLASVLWSKAPTETFKYGIEYAATVACALLSATFLPPRALISALTVGLLVIAVLSVALGEYAVDPLSGMHNFVGVFTSKNQLGFFLSLLLLAGMALAIDGRQNGPMRLVGVGAALLSLPLLVSSHSGTAVVSAALSAMAMLGNLALSRLSRFTRARLFLALGCTLVPIGALLLFAGDDMANLLLGALGKDATLTGRTVLWQRAAQLIPEHPLLGVGYQAFWLQDDVNAESLWQQFHIQSRGGFHFHSAMFETVIELGMVGAALLAVMVGRVSIDVLRWSWRCGSVTAAFFVGLQFCLLTRAFVEVDFLGQFQIGTFMLLVACSYAAQRLEEA